MKKAITMVLPTLAGLMLLAGSASADYAKACGTCHGADGKKLAKADLTVAEVAAKCKASLTTAIPAAMKALKVEAPDTVDSLCAALPKAAAAAPAAK